MGIRRKIVIGLLALGTVLGFGTGFATVAHRHAHRDEMARRLAAVCVDAALEARSGEAGVGVAAVADDERGCDRTARFEALARRLCAEEGARRSAP